MMATATFIFQLNFMHEEIFGPVLPIATFETFEEALEMANDCDYGLTSSIFTQNLDLAMRACKEIKFGETYINREHFECMIKSISGRLVKRSQLQGKMRTIR